MSAMLQRISLLIALSFAVCSLAVFPAAADDVLLSNNTGEEFAVFFIKDEPSFVMNGFDLTPLGVPIADRAGRGEPFCKRAGSGKLFAAGYLSRRQRRFPG